MYPRICPSRPSHMHGLAFEAQDDVFESALNCRQAWLHLPPVVIGAVVREVDSNAAHGLAATRASRLPSRPGTEDNCLDHTPSPQGFSAPLAEHLDRRAHRCGL